MKKVQVTRVQKTAPVAKQETASLTPEEIVRLKMIIGIDKYIALAGERKIEQETSYVSNLKEGHRVILYGRNLFENQMVEYEGPLGFWRCHMTRTLRLKGQPFIDQHKTRTRGQQR